MVTADEDEYTFEAMVEETVVREAKVEADKDIILIKWRGTMILTSGHEKIYDPRLYKSFTRKKKGNR